MWVPPIVQECHQQSEQTLSVDDVEATRSLVESPLAFAGGKPLTIALESYSRLTRGSLSRFSNFSLHIYTIHQKCNNLLRVTKLLTIAVIDET